MPMIPLTDVPSAAAGSARLAGYLARPAGEGPWPGVVVVHEAFGLDDVARRQTDRLAAAGYLALAPDLFADGGSRRCLIPTLRAVSSGQGKAFADIEAARVYLDRHVDCTGRIGVIGFCMGGAFALLTAPRGFDVASDNYGDTPKDLSVLADACPIVASYGGKDPARLAKKVPALEEALTRLGVEHDIAVYPEAGHSFMNDAPNGPRWMRPLLKVINIRPDPEAAADSWARIETYFERYLKQ